MAGAGGQLAELAVRTRDLSPSDGSPPQSLLLRARRGNPIE